MAEITPKRLLCTGELKEYVKKYSTQEMNPFFENAFQEIERCRIQGLRITIVMHRGNCQVMLDNLNDKKYKKMFKEIYRK